MGRAAVGKTLAAAIDATNHEKKPIRFTVKYHTRWQAGICKICGQPFQMITQEHAHSHGFANADVMAKSDMMDWR